MPYEEESKNPLNALASGSKNAEPAGENSLGNTEAATPASFIPVKYGCQRYPNLRLADAKGPGVKFRGGILEVHSQEEMEYVDDLLQGTPRAVKRHVVKMDTALLKKAEEVAKKHMRGRVEGQPVAHAGMFTSAEGNQPSVPREIDASFSKTQ